MLAAFVAAVGTAAGCSVHVLPGVGSTQGGGGSSLGTQEQGGGSQGSGTLEEGGHSQGSGTVEAGGASQGSGTLAEGGASQGSGTFGQGGASNVSSCTPTCDCHAFCATAAPCYAQNFDMSECEKDCQTNVPGDLRQFVCNATDCDGVHLAEGDGWYGAGSCASPWTGSGDSLDACLNCWNFAASGACFLTERAYEADSSALALDTCIDSCHYTTSCIIDCEQKHPHGVVNWDSAVGCAACGVCESACAGTDLSNYVCGVDGPTTN